MILSQAIWRRLKVLPGLLAAAAILGGFLTAVPARAMSLTPMVAEITVTGAGSSARIQVGNQGDQPMPYETHITRVEFDEHGGLHETPADDDFLVFPPQGLVGAKASQVIRVQWLGDPELKTSRSYYLEVRQIPVALTPDAEPTPQRSVKIQVIYRIKALLTVAPRGAKSKVWVVSVDPEMIDPPKRPPLIDPQTRQVLPGPPPQPQVAGLRVVLENDGERHALMGGVNWILEGTGADGKPFRVTMPQEKVNGAIGVGYLPPGGGKRIFNIPFDQPHQGPVTIRFTE